MATATVTPTANLTERAMLVNLSISQWTATKNDKKVNREVAVAHGNDETMGRYNKSLVAKTALERIKKLAGEARTEHYHRTLPWRDGGDRVLSSAGYFEYAKIMRDKAREFTSAAEDFVANYPQLIAEARISLNGLFNPDDYPAVGRIADKFSFRYDVLPMPTAEDFRINLGTAETARIRQQIESDARGMLEKAMQNVWERMQDVVAHMVVRLRGYEELPNGKVKGPFRDSLITNIEDLLQVLPTLNLTDDGNISRFATDIRKHLTAYTPDQLRNSATVRDDVATRAEEILSKMSAFVS